MFAAACQVLCAPAADQHRTALVCRVVLPIWGLSVVHTIIGRWYAADLILQTLAILIGLIVRLHLLKQSLHSASGAGAAAAHPIT